MANIIAFNTHNEYLTYRDGDDYVSPNVSYCEDEKDLHYDIVFSSNGSDYNWYLLLSLKAIRLIENEHYITVSEFKNLNAIYIENIDTVSDDEYAAILNAHPDYVWFANDRWQSSSNYHSSVWDSKVPFGMDSSNLPE